MAPRQRPNTRIEICGGIASGKTTLCGLFDDTAFECVIERFQENPFWEPFYRDPLKYNFETEITFLLQHYSQIKQTTRDAVCDFSLLQDLSYSQVNLKGGRLSAFRAVYEQVVTELPRPSLIVHLECPVEVEFYRISARKRSAEMTIELSYLEDLNRAITKAVKAAENKTPVLRIDSSLLDFAHDVTVQAQVVAQIVAALGNDEIPSSRS